MINIFQQSQHHNIIHLEDYFENKEHIYLCLELHSKMTLFDFVKKYNDAIEETRVQEIGNKIGQALESLHENGIVLKNLESSGILMTEVDSEFMLNRSIPRISRLNKAEIMGYGAHCHSIFGDIRFRAPEVVSGKHYDFKADSWSFGVILFQLLTGKLPFDCSQKREGSPDPGYPASEIRE